MKEKSSATVDYIAGYLRFLVLDYEYLAQYGHLAFLDQRKETASMQPGQTAITGVDIHDSGDFRAPPVIYAMTLVTLEEEILPQTWRVSVSDGKQGLVMEQTLMPVTVQEDPL